MSIHYNVQQHTNSTDTTIMIKMGIFRFFVLSEKGEPTFSDLFQYLLVYNINIGAGDAVRVGEKVRHTVHSCLVV